MPLISAMGASWKSVEDFFLFCKGSVFVGVGACRGLTAEVTVDALSGFVMGVVGVAVFAVFIERRREEAGRLGWGTLGGFVGLLATYGWVSFA